MPHLSRNCCVLVDAALVDTAVACGSISYNDPISGLQVNSFIQRLPNSIPIDPSSWFNEYRVSALSDSATGIEWEENDSLVISGARGEFFMPPSQGFSLRVKAVDGAPTGPAVRYEALVLTDVIEEINPVTNPNGRTLCFSGYRMREADPTDRSRCLRPDRGAAPGV